MAAILAYVAQLAMYGHHLVTEWIDLALYNHVRGVTLGQHVASTIVAGLPAATGTIALATGLRWLAIVSTIAWGVLLLTEVLNWWVPYLFARYPWEVNPDSYAKWGLDKTHKLLPPFRGHPVVPDTQHLIVMLLTTAAFATMLWVVV